MDICWGAYHHCWPGAWHWPWCWLHKIDTHTWAHAHLLLQYLLGHLGPLGTIQGVLSYTSAYDLFNLWHCFHPIIPIPTASQKLQLIFKPSIIWSCTQSFCEGLRWIRVLRKVVCPQVTREPDRMASQVHYVVCIVCWCRLSKGLVGTEYDLRKTQTMAAGWTQV